ncbi:THUMP domain-containing protein 2 isoform X1 [Solea senegalensis]|uniref:THUMP domain-containing protein 2 isoform X1 n=1 Tax=Solea senegalensis TaxID=28829 RepID=A0AAV6S7D0_SOLSE|nr:THUMP domain-containing protein 2 [Solea senegalensis]KAG7512758.1 THUMP domain-containing protein 2 isoform X1 [Solea senegalensis]
MSESRGKGKFVRYYCTAGNGMEPFLTDEVKRKLAAENVCQMPGKVLFSSTEAIDKIIKLKAAERLFLLLKHDSPVRLPAHASPGKAASVLQSTLLGDRNQWTSAVMTWSRLKGELADKQITVDASSLVRDEISEREERRGSAEQMGEEERAHVETGKSAGEQREEESKTRRLKSADERDAHTLEKKRKKEMVQRVDEFSSDEDKGQVLKKKMKMVVDGTEDNEEQAKSNREEDKALLQPSKIKPGFTSSDPVTFRISCKCTGSLSRCFSSTQEVNKVIGLGLGRLLGWKTDLKNPQLEVNVYLSDDHCLLGIPLTRLPLANRSYIKTTGLRATVAWAMASLAQIQPGFCVVDPMCGVGTILMEAAQENKGAFFLGVDIDDRQLQKASENIKFAEVGNRIHLLKASSMMLPLPSASVDAVVCDLPFGRKFGNKANMAANLPVIVTEMERVLCVGGTLVLLLSPQLSFVLKKLLAQKQDTGPTSNLGTKDETGKQDCMSPSLSTKKQQTVQIHQGVKSSPTQETDTETGLHLRLPPAISSLKHQATLRVSLGAIDGLIHKYVKSDVR